MRRLTPKPAAFFNTSDVKLALEKKTMKHLMEKLINSIRARKREGNFYFLISVCIEIPRRLPGYMLNFFR